MTPSVQLSLCCVVAIAVAGCSKKTNEEVGQATENASALIQTVKALEIKSTGPARMLQGRFEIRDPHPGEKSIESLGLGGACLLAMIPNNPPKSCTKDEECDIPTGKRPNPEYWGYCLSGQCWVKGTGAGDPYCNKGVSAGEHSVPTTPLNTTSLYNYVASHPGSKTPVRWRVLACLNGEVGDPTKRTCAGDPGPVLHDEGNPRSVP
jgi:hypothetical protein